MKKMQRKRNLNKEITIMVLYDSQKKPFQFRIPILLIKSLCVFFGLITIVSGILFVGNRMLSKRVADTAARNADLSNQVVVLESSGKEMESQKAALEESVQVKESEVEELKGLAEDTNKQLQELYQKEEELNQQMESVFPTMDSTSNEAQEQSFTVAVDNSYGYVDPAEPIQMPEGVVLASADLYGLHLPLGANSGSEAQNIKADFLRMQDEMKKQSGEYDQYIHLIQSEEFHKKLREEEMMELREGVVDFAKSFIGGRYVWGGTNPHVGADCSGFAQYVLGHSAGVWLNRTAAAQSSQGKKVDISQAKPGDLIFYGHGGGINHVAVYVGGGKVVHASNERIGIVMSNWNYRTPSVIKNVIGE